MFVKFTLGGATLGTANYASVTISKSDYPNGKFGFKGIPKLIKEIPNPDRTKNQMLTIVRSGGLTGKQQVQ